jgi:hypothetical protein
MKRKIGGKSFKNRDELKKELKKIWNNIKPDFCRKL